MMSTSTPQDSPPIELWRLALLPVGMLGGLLAGVTIGALFLPYLMLQEFVRKLAQQWSWFDGWVEWSEGRKSEAKRGWYVLWLVWICVFVALWLSVGVWAGILVGPFVGAWVMLVPDGLARLQEASKSWLARFRRLEIRIEDPSERDAA